MGSGNKVNKKLQALREFLEEEKLNRDDALLPQLKCSVCQETCLPPIFMCRNEHNLCYTCRQQVWACPTCGEKGRPGIKNRAAERISKQFTVDCRYKQRGCRSVVLKNKMDDHLVDCLYRYSCTMCILHGGYYGDLPGWIQHFAAKHNCDYTPGSEYASVMQAASYKTRYLSCHDALFRIHIESQENEMRLYTHFYGPRKNAVDFHSLYEFVCEDGSKCSYRVPCLPMDKHYKQEHYVVVSPDDVQRLKRTDGTITFKIIIERLNVA